jgi:Spy/CpxP family protein refolding chaperone
MTMRKLILSIFILAATTFAVAAQDAKPEASPEQPRQPNLLQQLGLTPEQVAQVKQINQQRKPLMEEAQRRMRDANKALDAAIYADNVDETDVRAKLEEVQRAQSELARLRFTNELAIRKVLTPDQLVRFRDMRQRFELAREDMQQRRKEKMVNGIGPARDPARQNMRRLLRQQRLQQQKPPAATTAPQKPTK